MNNILPILNNQIKVCIVCEGFEDYEYLMKLIELNVFNKIYNIDLVNAKSISSFFAYYQDKFANKSYNIVLVFCDTDRDSIYYNKLKEKINEHHDCIIANDIVIFAKPCTMLIFLSHFTNKISLRTQNKKKNANLIEELTGVKNYDAHAEQRTELFSLITKENYYKMKESLSKISNDDSKSPSTNFCKLLNYLENSNVTWIDSIRNKLEN